MNNCGVLSLPPDHKTVQQHEMRTYRERCYPAMITEQWWENSYELEMGPLIHPLAEKRNLLIWNRRN